MKHMILFAAALFFCCCASVNSAEKNTKLDLNGKWQFAPENGQTVEVSVPHTWNAIDGFAGPKSKKGNAKSVCSESYLRMGAVYSRALPLNPKKGKRYFIKGEGASICSEVLINGQSVGKHEGAFTAFCYDITDALQENDNVIAVRVDNKFNQNVTPLAGDFTMFGGLYRDIYVIEKNEACIAPDLLGCNGVILDWAVDQNALNAEIIVRAKDEKVSAEIELRDPKGTIIPLTSRVVDAKDGKVQKLKDNPYLAGYVTDNFDVICLSAQLREQPQRWSPEQPKLYTVTTILKDKNGQEIDRVEQKFGFRTFALSAKDGAVLNEKGRKLRGVCRHQDREGKGWAISHADEKEDMNMIKEMGADALRMGHYPNAPYIYELCDELGIVVWSEISCIERVMSTPEFRANANKQAAEMVLQHYNHPSVCMWGFFNEIYHQNSASDAKADMLNVLREINATIKSLDVSRPTVSATNIARKDLCAIPDAFGANMYPGWYGGNAESLGNSVNGYRSMLPERAFCVSEYGFGADELCHEIPPKRPSTTGRRHPEEYQSYGHEQNYIKILACDGMFGSYIWNMFDFASAERSEGRRAGMNDKGLVTYDRKVKKDAFYFYKANWAPNTVVIHLNSKTFVERKGETTIIRGYVNLPEAELRVNGVSLGKLKPSDVKVVEWKDVPLKMGENRIELRALCGDIMKHDTMVIKRIE